jgi:hypothetical protein
MHSGVCDAIVGGRWGRIPSFPIRSSRQPAMEGAISSAVRFRGSDHRERRGGAPYCRPLGLEGVVERRPQGTDGREWPPDDLRDRSDQGQDLLGKGGAVLMKPSTEPKPDGRSCRKGGPLFRTTSPTSGAPGRASWATPPDELAQRNVFLCHPSVLLEQGASLDDEGRSSRARGHFSGALRTFLRKPGALVLNPRALVRSAGRLS